MKKKIFWGIMLLSAIALTFFLLRTSRTEHNYQVTNISIGNIQKTINIDAKVIPKKYANISAEIPALIEKVNVSVNDTVKKGDVLFELNKTSVEAQVKNAQLAVDRAELAEKKARRSWDLMKPEDRESIKKASEQAREKLKEIKAQAKKTTIDSPIDGIIIKQDARAGDISNGILIKIIEPSSLYLEGLIPEVDIARVHKGDKCYITFDAFPKNILNGTLGTMDISSTIDQNNTYYKININISNNENTIKILNGMNASVDIEIEQKDNVLFVPRDFAKKDDQGYFVYIKNSNNSKKEPFIKKYFKNGLIGNKKIEIISGLKKGDEVIKKDSK